MSFYNFLFTSLVDKNPKKYEPPMLCHILLLYMYVSLRYLSVSQVSHLFVLLDVHCTPGYLCCWMYNYKPATYIAGCTPVRSTTYVFGCTPVTPATYIAGCTPVRSETCAVGCTPVTPATWYSWMYTREACYLCCWMFGCCCTVWVFV